MFIRLNILFLCLAVFSQAATRHVRLEDPIDATRSHSAGAFVDDRRVNHLPQKLRAHALEFQEEYRGIEDPDAETNVFSKYLKGIVLLDGIGQIPDDEQGKELQRQAKAEGFDDAVTLVPNFNQSAHPLYGQANTFFGRYGAMLEGAAERGNPIGQHMKGLLLRFGIGVPADENRAFHLMLASAQSELYLRSANYVIRRYGERLNAANQPILEKYSVLLENPDSNVKSYLRLIVGPRRLNYEIMHGLETHLYMLPGSTSKHFELYGRLAGRLDGVLMTIRKAPITPGRVWGSIGLLSLSGWFIGSGVNRFAGTSHGSDVPSILTGVTAQLSFNAIVGFLKGLGDVGQLSARIQQTAQAAFCCRRTKLPPTWQISDLDHEARMTALFLTLHTHGLTNRHVGDIDALASPKVTAVERLLSQKMPEHQSLARWVMEMSTDPRYPEFHNPEVDR